MTTRPMITRVKKLKAKTASFMHVYTHTTHAQHGITHIMIPHDQNKEKQSNKQHKIAR